MEKISTYNENGEEIIDDTPIAVSVGFKRPPSIHEFLAKAVRYADHLRSQESLDQIPHPEDFALEDPEDLEFEKDSPYELVNDPDVGEVTRAEKKYLDHQRATFDKHWKGFKPRKKDSDTDPKKVPASGNPDAGKSSTGTQT